MRFGARNAIVGKVGTIKKGAIMCQVPVSVKGPVNLTSVMTVDSLNDMKLKRGDSVRVVVKAVHVLLVKD